MSYCLSVLTPEIGAESSASDFNLNYPYVHINRVCLDRTTASMFYASGLKYQELK